MAGLKFEIMPEPDNDSLQLGREFGNRGQCNPTYFTVGNLVKHLIYLRDELNIPTEKIISDYAFVTAGGGGLAAWECTQLSIGRPCGIRALVASESFYFRDLVMCKMF